MPPDGNSTPVHSAGTDTVVTGSWDVDPRHHTPRRIVHGGAWATAIEGAATARAAEVVTERRQFAVSADNLTGFLRRFGTAA